MADACCTIANVHSQELENSILANISVSSMFESLLSVKWPLMIYINIYYHRMSLDTVSLPSVCRMCSEIVACLIFDPIMTEVTEKLLFLV